MMPTLYFFPDIAATHVELAETALRLRGIVKAKPVAAAVEA
jgi:hypothetical protein